MKTEKLDLKTHETIDYNIHIIVNVNNDVIKLIALKEYDKITEYEESEENKSSRYHTTS